MAIKYQIENQANYLKVVASGRDDSLKEVISYSDAVMSAALEFSCKKILCDERELEYALSVSDTFELAEKVSLFASKLRKIAIVCNKDFLKDGKFYETVATNRGLFVRVTSDYDEAIAWLGI